MLDGTPNTFPLLELGVVEEVAWPKTGTVPKAAWLKVKPVDVFAGWPKVGACPKAGWPKPPVVTVPKADVLNPVATPCVVAAEVDAGMTTG